MIKTILKSQPWPKTLFGGFVFACGLICLIVTVVYLVGDVSLWVFGRHITAEAEALWAEQVGERDAGELSFQYFIRYQFTTPRGRVITGTSRAAAGEWAGLGISGQPHAVDDPFGGQVAPGAPVYQEQSHIPPESGMGGLEQGSPVDVVYFPLYPNHNRLDESRFMPLLACSYVPLIMLSLAGLAAGRYLLPARSNQSGSVNWLRTRFDIN